MIEAFVTNIGKYAEGELCGDWLKLPTTKEAVQSLLAKIGVDGVLYEEYFITAYNADIDGLSEHLGQYENVDELNYFASLLDDLDDWDLERMEAAIAHGYYTGSVKDLINVAQNLDSYDFYSDISDYDDLGRYLIDELGYETIPERLEDYFDYDSYGQAHCTNEGGEFVNGGFITCHGDSISWDYGGMEDIPDEYRVFAFPEPPEKMPIKAQLEMYGKMALAHAVADRPTPERAER